MAHPINPANSVEDTKILFPEEKGAMGGVIG